VSALSSFANVNRRLSEGLVSFWPHRLLKLEELYSVRAAEAVKRRPGQFVVDVGGGKSLRYARLIDGSDAHVVAVDISEEELAANTDVAETKVADVSKQLPFADAEVDVLTSSAVLEHLHDVPGFLDEAARVLKPGGVMVHFFPGRYAAFALLNRVVPERLKRQLMFRLYPETEGICGFPAYYDHCYASAIEKACRSRGFDVDVKVRYYGSAPYFQVFFPLFAVFLAFEVAAWALGLRDLASQVLVEAHRLPDA